MRFLSFSALALVLLSVESVLVRSFGFEVARVDVGLALVVYAALRATTLEGAFSAFSVGYLLDVFVGLMLVPGARGAGVLGGARRGPARRWPQPLTRSSWPRPRRSTRSWRCCSVG